MSIDPCQQLPEIPADDVVVVFRTQSSNIRGRLVRLGRDARCDRSAARHAGGCGSIALGGLGLGGALRLGAAGGRQSQSADAFERRGFDSRRRLRGWRAARGYARYDAESCRRDGAG